MNRLTAIMTISILLLLTGGCGFAGITSKAADNSADRVEVIWYTNGQRPADMDVVLAKANDYLLTKLNCTLKLVFVGDSEYDAKLTTHTAAGESYDIANSRPKMFDYRVTAGVGYIQPLDELLAQNAPQIKTAVNPLAFAATLIKGECYAVPLYSGLARQPLLVADAGQLTTERGQELVDAERLKILLERAHTLNPVKVAITNIGELPQMADLDYVVDGYFPAAVKYSDASCRIVNQFNDPEYIALLKTIRTAAQKKWYVRDMNNKESLAALAAGNAFAVIESQTYLEQLAKQKNNAYRNFRLTAKPRIASMDINNSALVLSATSEHPARAVRLIGLLCSDVFLKNLLTFGIEGRHYQKTATGQIRFLAAHAEYLIDESAFGNPMLDYIPEGQPADKWQQVSDYDATAVISPLAGFVVDVQPLKTLLPGIISVVAKYQSGLRSGLVDVDQTVLALNADLKANRLDEFLQELQRQVDEWKKRKK